MRIVPHTHSWPAVKKHSSTYVYMLCPSSVLTLQWSSACVLLDTTGWEYLAVTHVAPGLGALIANCMFYSTVGVSAWV